MLERLVRPEVSNLEAYEFEPSNRQIAEVVGLQESLIKRFDLNTVPYTLKSIMQKLAQDFPELPVNEYPDTSYAEFTRLSAEYTQTDDNMIVIGAGADECVDIAAKTFLGRGTETILPVPTYSMFRVVTEIMGAQPQEVLRQDDFSMDVDALLAKINDKTRIIFLCNPNNPTANATPRKDIERLLGQAHCMIFVDEAYYEFYGKSVVDLTYDFENLVVLRTLSKAFCMAGMRAAFLVANWQTIQLLHKIRPPNSLCVITVKMAEAALSQPYMIKKIATSIVQERRRLHAKLDCLEGVTTFPSDANFLLMRFNKVPAKKVHQELLQKGIVTRDVSNLPLLENCLRITVRTSEDDDFLLESLEEILGNQ